MIGAAIGAGDYNKAKRYFKIMNIIVLTNVMILSSTLFALKDIIMEFYIKDEIIKYELNVIFIVLAVTSFPDSYKGFVRGVTKSLGLQYILVYLNIMAGIVILFNIWLLAFKFNMQSTGLYSSKLIGEIFSIAIFLALI